MRRGFRISASGEVSGARSGAEPICSTSPAFRRTPRMAAELAEGEGRAAAEIVRHVDAAAHGDISADAAAFHAVDLQHLRRLDRNGLPVGNRLAIETSLSSSAPARQITVSLLNFSVGPESVVSIPAAFSSLPTQPVGQPERQRVHRPGGRHTDRPIAEAARPILNRGLRAGARTSMVSAL